MNADKERQKKVFCTVWNESTSPNITVYTLSSYSSDNPQLKYCRPVCLEKLKYESNINKAEHGYNIGMHASINIL